jgi:H+/gluconate symporter-like permease
MKLTALTALAALATFPALAQPAQPQISLAQRLTLDQGQVTDMIGSWKAAILQQQAALEAAQKQVADLTKAGTDKDAEIASLKKQAVDAKPADAKVDAK